MIAWIDHRFVRRAVPLSIAGPVFRCGVGLFETILHHADELPRFERHLQRLRTSLAALPIAPNGPPPILGESERLREVVMEVLQANSLVGKTARVNLFCFQDSADGKASLCVAATPHSIHTDSTCTLDVYPHAHTTHLCVHKTMANMHQRLAWDQARNSGKDDAVLQDHDGRILECAVAAVLFSDGTRFVTSRTPFKLPSLTMEAAAQALPIEEIPIALADVGHFKHAYRLNSLIGIQPVAAIGRVTFEPDWKTCKPLLRQLLGLGE
ncbi:MAG: aminotransferase class IV [Acidobacteriota bacterium]